MEIQLFLSNFADQFDDTDSSEFTAETRFRDLDEWSSLNSLAIVNMIGKKYSVHLKPVDMNAINSIQELYNLILTQNS